VPALAAAGARVAVNYSSDREGAEQVARTIIDGGGEAIAIGKVWSGYLAGKNSTQGGDR
jgi:hypothetical protein